MLHTLRFILFPVLHVLGPTLIWFGAAMLVPLLTSWAQGDGMIEPFALAVGAAALCGLALTLCFRPFRRELSVHHGFLLVALTWTLVPVFAAIPLYLHLPEYGFARCYFEMMSCLTTTGSTVITGLDELPLSLNGWRCFLSWLGGMGLIVLSVAVLPLLGVGGAQIIKAELSGPLKETKLTPRIAETARALYIIYFGISVACTIAYHLAGMHWEDAVLHMMTTVSLSGIAAHDASFAYFESGPIQVVAIFFMVVCGCNFSLHFVAWRRRNPLLYLLDPEARSWLLVLAALVAAITLALLHLGIYRDASSALLDVAFSVVSTASTTGYATVDYSLWPYGIPFLMLFSAAFASCAGSTGGGIKMIRLIILVKQTVREFRHLLYPTAVLPITVGRQPVTNELASAVMAYALLWVFSCFVGTFVMIATGMPPLEGFSATIASITNLGPGLGAVGPVGTYADLSDLQLSFLSFFMLIGRLELFTVFILFTRSFWRTW